MIQRADQQLLNKKTKALLWGTPKDSGKTTGAMTMPATQESPILVLQYDTGNLTIPPGVDPASVYVKVYPDVLGEAMDADTDKWQIKKAVAGQIITDLNTIYDAFNSGKPIQLIGDDGKPEAPVPLPGGLILDGLTQLHEFIVAWICSINKITSFADESDAWKLWGRRTTIMMKYLRRAVSLPIHVAMTTWQTEEKIRNEKGAVIGIKAIWPDVGGQMDWKTAGLVDASLYCTSRKGVSGTQFIIKTKSSGFVQGVGVRGRYDLKDEVDVTIDAKTGIKPYQWIWSVMQQ